MARWRALLLCVALLAAAGAHAAAAEAEAPAADDAPPDFSKMRVKQLQARVYVALCQRPVLASDATR